MVRELPSMTTSVGMQENRRPTGDGRPGSGRSGDWAIGRSGDRANGRMGEWASGWTRGRPILVRGLSFLRRGLSFLRRGLSFVVHQPSFVVHQLSFRSAGVPVRAVMPIVFHITACV